MNSLRTWFVLLALVLGFAGTGTRVQAQSEKPAGDSGQPASATASKAEVEQLRQELAAQRRTIEQLKTLVEQLAEVKSRAPAPAPATEGAHLVNASMTVPATAPVAEAEPPAEPYQKPPEKKEGAAAPITAGWNGEHFFIKSADGQFQIQPYGYVQGDFRSYLGDGAPPSTFNIRRARFGFQGNYGSRYQFAILIDSTSATAATIRDVYLNVKYNDQLQFQGGQFKVPFAQEVATAATNLDFVERGLQALLYPDAASAFRSPGFLVHGDVHGGALQYWAGVFNGKGFAVNNTTSIPETIGRVRFYPWKTKKESALQGLAIGGSIAYGVTRGLSRELSPNMTLTDASYTYIPQFQVNGNVWRYEGEFTYLNGPLGIRGEYVQALFDRTGVGTLTLGGLGFANLPNVLFKAWDSSVTYLLTKERRPENGTPRVKHPLFGPTEAGATHGLGAWELAFRYTGIQGKEPGIFFNNIFTPQSVPAFDVHTDQFTFGVNWYWNYWIKFQSNINIDRLKEPSTIGATPQNYVVFQQRLQYRF
jgi:phosphate-selective porin OprO/OprP